MKRGFSITKRSVLWLSIGAVATAISRWLFATNINLSIDFTGGLQAHIQQPLNDNVASSLEKMALANNWKLEDISIKNSETGSDLLLKMHLETEEVAKARDAVKNTLINTNAITDESQIDNLSFVWPSIGDFIKQSAINALIIGIALMAIYMMISFGDVRKVIPPYILASN